ncbi:MAG: RusA family crossover junction endodeoxyribonuclease [Candidatus Pacearchaeota archaeon]
MRDKRNNKVADNYYAQLGGKVIMHGVLSEVLTNNKKATIEELRKELNMTERTREPLDLSKDKLDVAIVVYLQKSNYQIQDVDNLAKVIIDSLKKPKLPDGNPYFFEDDNQIVRLLVYKLERKENENANTCQISISIRKHDPKQEMELFVGPAIINGMSVGIMRFSEIGQLK